jgi:hypothetical protein
VSESPPESKRPSASELIADLLRLYPEAATPGVALELELLALPPLRVSVIEEIRAYRAAAEQR